MTERDSERYFSSFCPLQITPREADCRHAVWSGLMVTAD